MIYISLYSYISNAINGFFFLNAGAIVLHNYYFERVWPHHIIDINCTGAENNLGNCSQNSFIDIYTCSPDHDAAVSCQGTKVVQK